LALLHSLLSFRGYHLLRNTRSKSPVFVTRALVDFDYKTKTKNVIVSTSRLPTTLAVPSNLSNGTFGGDYSAGLVYNLCSSS
jgi:hypothetical protein